MTHRSYAVSLAAAVLAAAGLLAAASATLEPVSGDLARIGRFDESEYGWRAPQERRREPLFDVSPSRVSHDLVVLGDSFSQDPHAGWPGDLAAETGARVASFHLGGRTWRALLADPGYRASPPKVFILQVVERDARRWLADPAAPCAAAAPAPSPRLTERPRPVSYEPVERPTRRGPAELDAREFVQFQWARLLRRLGRRSGEAVAVGLTRRAFTSRRADSTLVYAGDLLKAYWTPADLRAVSCGLARMQDEVQRGGKTLFLAVLIPDKLTAYAPLLADRSLAGLGVLDRLDAPGLQTVPAAEALAQAVQAGVLDVYLPDDSHLGRAGHLAVARAVSGELRRRGALSPSRGGRLATSN